MLAGPAGRIEALLEEPDQAEPTFTALVCHPHPQHGGTMHNKVVYRLARGLRKAGAAVLRFNYRGVNLSEGAYAGGVGEVEDAAAALAWLRQRYPDLPFWLAGFSFGSRIVLQLGCREPLPEKILALGFPSLRPDADDALHCPAPRVFIQSENDEYSPPESFRTFFDKVSGAKQLIWIRGNDHFFTGALDELEEAIRSMAIHV
ncbi:MAG: alpha/beta fold hydrolase [Acidobacteriia bacterium]|nr:alpha/beta fold hydrolase [Terriglobia bacterium]